MSGWFILDVMRKYRGRRNVWVALLVDRDPDDIALYDLWRATQSRWLGRHKTRDEAWDHTETLMATRIKADACHLGLKGIVSKN